MMTQAMGGNLSLHIPATADITCSCFCFKKQKPTPVVLRGNSLLPLRKAELSETALAVQAIYAEVMRRVNDQAQASRVLECAGLSLEVQPDAITVEQVRIIQDQLGG